MRLDVPRYRRASLCGVLSGHSMNVRTRQVMRKRLRIDTRWAEADATLVRTAARTLGMSVSELIRRATIQAAVEALRRGTVPPAEPVGR